MQKKQEKIIAEPQLPAPPQMLSLPDLKKEPAPTGMLSSQLRL